jgi:hypothetical protein
VLGREFHVHDGADDPRDAAGADGGFARVTYCGIRALRTSSGPGSNSYWGSGPDGPGSSVSSISSGSSRRTEGRWVSMDTKSVATRWTSSTPPSSAPALKASISRSEITSASRYFGAAEKPSQLPARSSSRNRCQPMPLRPVTYSTGSTLSSRSAARSRAASRRTLAL